MKHLLKLSLQSSTREAYDHHWRSYIKFHKLYLPSQSLFPVTPLSISLFITHLHTLPLRSSTIRNYLSAISYVLRILGKPDPTTSFLVNKTVKGISKIPQKRRLPLLPITKSILLKLLGAIPFCVSSIYTRRMYTALFLITFFACLRAGEIVHSNKKSHTLQMHQLQSIKSKTSNKNSYQIKFASFKHSTNMLPVVILSPVKGALCPVTALKKYLNVRGQYAGPLFLKQNKKPLTRSEFTSFLKECIAIEGLPEDRYNTHSFRIGRATQLAQEHTKVDIIKNTGRWKSSAYEKYIRPTHFNLPM